MPPPFILAASPRPDGNCDAAARLFSRGFAEGIRANAGAETELPAPVALREYQVHPCVSCGTCSRTDAPCFLPDLDATEHAGVAQRPPTRQRPAFGCPLTTRDTSVSLLTALLTAPVLCLVAPIYFYHLPAAFKALIDRTQPFWIMAEARDTRLAALPPRECHTILIAARERGEQLFSGALLTLRQALKPLRVSLSEPLLLRGMDAAGDLASRPDAVRAVLDYGRAAGRTLPR